MNSLGVAIASITGRLLLTAIFLMSAIANKIPQFEQVAAMMAGEGVPFPRPMLVGAILFLIVGGLSVLVGYQARIGAGLLLVFLILATYFFHDFWTIDDPAKAAPEMINFLKNLALMGAMLLIIANGSGAGSLDRLWGRSKATVPDHSA